jgi:protease II
VLIYEEPDPEFSLRVENTLSSDYVQIHIQTQQKPYSNEIWLRNASDPDENFWLF